MCKKQDLTHTSYSYYEKVLRSKRLDPYYILTPIIFSIIFRELKCNVIAHHRIKSIYPPPLIHSIFHTENKKSCKLMKNISIIILKENKIRA